MSTTVTPATDARLGFTSLEEETALDRLPVTGEVPGWLAGALVRVTPALLEVGGRRLAHWFDGLAMLNRFGFAGGQVSYKSRYLRSRAYEKAQDGELMAGFATDPCRSIFKRAMTLFDPVSALTDNGVVNVAKLGEQYLALTETPLPVEFEADTLETLGVTDWSKKIPGVVTTAHPHGDEGVLINYAIQ